MVSSSQNTKIRFDAKSFVSFLNNSTLFVPNYNYHQKHSQPVLSAAHTHLESCAHFHNLRCFKQNAERIMNKVALPADH